MDGGSGRVPYDPLPGEARPAPGRDEEEGLGDPENGEEGLAPPADTQTGGGEGNEGPWDPETEEADDPAAVVLAKLGEQVQNTSMLFLAFAVWDFIYPMLLVYLDEGKERAGGGSQRGLFDGIVNKAILGWVGFYCLTAFTGAYAGMINRRGAFYFRGYLIIMAVLEGLARFILFIYFFTEVFGGKDVEGGLSGYDLFKFGYHSVIFAILVGVGIANSCELHSAIASALPYQIEQAKAIRKRNGRRSTAGPSQQQA